MKKPVILAICGSTRSASSNLTLIHSIARLGADRFDFQVFQGLEQLPHFNPDIDGLAAPSAVVGFREQVRMADGVLLCTPEYA
ncbi:MAG: flavoprotein, partial [Chitinophagaceae bacterium]